MLCSRGSAIFNVPIPAGVNLDGLQVFTQAMVLDPAGAFARMLSVTAGLELILATN